MTSATDRQPSDEGWLIVVIVGFEPFAGRQNRDVADIFDLAGALPDAVRRGIAINENKLIKRTFTVDSANKVWVADITYIRTWQGWLYLAVVVDLYARKVVGWSMKPTLSRELALDAFNGGVATPTR